MKHSNPEEGQTKYIIVFQEDEPFAQRLVDNGEASSCIVYEGANKEDALEVLKVIKKVAINNAFYSTAVADGFTAPDEENPGDKKPRNPPKTPKPKHQSPPSQIQVNHHGNGITLKEFKASGGYEKDGTYEVRFWTEGTEEASWDEPCHKQKGIAKIRLDASKGEWTLLEGSLVRKGADEEAECSLRNKCSGQYRRRFMEIHGGNLLEDKNLNGYRVTDDLIFEGKSPYGLISFIIERSARSDERVYPC